tara:strand:- start:1137 stop:1310 length:174 start_codon:yes stop_codon:yes gene_type:complete
MNPLEKKRANYLSFYKDGVYDGLFNQEKDPNKKSSAYYAKGFDYGLELLAHLLSINR